jgi:hypothetical protein
MAGSSNASYFYVKRKYFTRLGVGEIWTVSAVNWRRIFARHYSHCLNITTEHGTWNGTLRTAKCFSPPFLLNVILYFTMLILLRYQLIDS